MQSRLVVARLGVQGRREVGMLIKECHRDAGDETFCTATGVVVETGPIYQ